MTQLNKLLSKLGFPFALSLSKGAENRYGSTGSPRTVSLQQSFRKGSNVKATKLALLALTAMILTACNNTANQNSATQNQTTQNTATQQTSDTMNTAQTNEEANIEAIGGQTDEHGCLPSAGQTWSELRQTCLQIFDVGIRLNPVEVKDGDAIISAFALYNDDKSKVEIFLPSAYDEHNVILPKSSDDVYEAQNYKFDAKTNTLFIQDKEAYKGE